MLNFPFFRQDKDVSELKTEDVRVFLLGKFDRDRRDLENKLLQVSGDIKTQLKTISPLISALQEKSSAQTYANTVKAKFCEKAMEALRSVPDYNANYDSARNFVVKARDAVATISGLNMKEFRHLHSFKDDMAKIAEKIRVLEPDISFAAKLISESVMSKIDAVNSETEKISALRKSIVGKDEQIAEARKSVEMLREMGSAQGTKIDELARKLAAYSAERASQREIESSMDSLKQTVENEFAGLDRILKKYLYFGELTKTESAMLKAYIKGPAEAFLETDTENVIRGVLDSICYFKNREAIGIDEEKLNKVRELMRNFSLLSDMRDKYRGLAEKIRLAEQEFSEKAEPVSKELRELKAELDRQGKDMEIVESSVRSTEAEKKEFERQFDDTRIRIELMLAKLLNRSIRIL